MAQITLTLDLTPETLEILNLLINGIDGKTEEKPAKNKTSKTKKSAETKEAVEETPKDDVPWAEDEAEPRKIEMADVRAIALKLSKAKKQAELKKIFAKYGATKLSDITEEKYPELMADLEAASE